MRFYYLWLESSILVTLGIEVKKSFQSIKSKNEKNN